MTLEIKRDQVGKRGFILSLGQKIWKITLKEARYLYNRLKHYRVYDPGLGEFGVLIRNYREANNLTQEELAGKLGISRMHVIRLEAGRHEPKAKTLGKLKKLGILPKEQK